MVQFEVKFESNDTWKVVRYIEIGPKVRFGEIVSIHSNKDDAFKHAERLSRNISLASFTVPSVFVLD